MALVIEDGGRYMERMRLDRYLTECGLGSRREVRDYIKAGRVHVSEIPITSVDYKVEDGIQIMFDGKLLNYEPYRYYMLHKPMGVVSATEDNHCKTVLDLLIGVPKKDLFPVGRLDKDTEGLLLVTNDGALAHKLLSPKLHVDKVYYAKIAGNVTADDVITFRKGIKINEEFTCMPAELKILVASEVSEIELTIQEGKFHQVKRMFAVIGRDVIYLKRLSMGGLHLDKSILPGQFRKLTKEEVHLISGDHIAEN